ncbi:MAG: efflux RND transporter periplasmic adaptor subunit [Clostridiales bacterium]|nr:efflux RND transporter periplasmic adaptor subunit [Clostridiales bacterium]
MKKLFWNRITAVLLVAACMSAALTGCGAQAKDAEEEAKAETVAVDVQPPVQGVLKLKNEFMGTVSPEEAVYVIPLVSAEVLSTNVEVGDTVQAGDVLCKLDSEAAQLQLASAQAQYSSATAGLNTAQTGYNSAVAQYASAEAQADAQLGGAKKLQDYQTDVNIDKIKDGIADIEENIDDIDEDKDKAKKKYKEAEDEMEDAQKALESAKQEFSTAQTRLAEAKSSVSDNSAITTEEQARIDAAEKELESAKKTLESAGKSVESAATTYATKKAEYNALKDAKDDLKDTLSDTKDSLEQAETMKKITDEDIYADTKKIVDTTKGAAMSGVDTAEAQVESAKVGIQAAQVGVDSAQYQLDMYTLTAPISGVIESVNVENHSFASSGSPAFVISNKATMTVTFYVSEGIRNTFQPGESVEIEKSGKIYPAAITEIGTMVDQTTGLFEIKASVTAQDNGLLTGSSVKVIADTYEQSDALLIPYDAVYYENSQLYVYVAVDGKAVRKDIETGIFDEMTITVTSGLETTDQVIVSWSSSLRDGAEISVKNAADTAPQTETKQESQSETETQTEVQTEAAE